MLKNIEIENIAVIEKASIELSGGFCVMTGETGAGKSIVIDSINAVLGERTSKDLIRTGCNKARVTAVFDGVSESAEKYLEDNNIDYDGELIVSRTISSDGKNNCRINGSPVTVTMLRELGKFLINIHGQHDNQMLFNADNHLKYIDSFAEDGNVLEDYLYSFLKLRDVKRKLRSIETDKDEKQRTVELLTYQINEIESADVKIGEIEELENRKITLKNFQKLSELLGTVNEYLNGNETASGAVELAENSVLKMSELAELDKKYSQLNERLNSASLDLREIASDISDTLDALEADPDEIDKVEDRLNMYYSFRNKYGKTEEEILGYLSSAKEKLKNIEISEELTDELLEKQDKYTEEVYKKGLKLTNTRKKAAEKFCFEVCEILNYLEMPNVKLTADFSEGIYNKTGCDRVEFLISANAGETPKPLIKIVSGGELSRIMLAIKSIMAERDEVNTLIFDEIDTGISGRTAERVGKQLKKLSESHQIICVTHLSQIAAAAGTHMLIEKSVAEKNTYTTVRELKGDDRVREIARIMSGSQISDSVLSAAREMLSNS